MSTRTLTMQTRATVKTTDKNKSNFKKQTEPNKIKLQKPQLGKVSPNDSNSSIDLIPDTQPGNEDLDCLESSFSSAVSESNTNPIHKQASANKRRSISFWDLVSHDKLTKERDELKGELEVLTSENMEMRAAILKKDELLVIKESELNELQQQLQKLTDELEKQKHESDNLLKTVGVLSDDLNKKERVVIEKLDNLESTLLNLKTSDKRTEKTKKEKKKASKSKSNKSTKDDTKNKIMQNNLIKSYIQPVAVTNRKNKVLILGSSHARDFGIILQRMMPNHKVMCYCYPNGRFQDIIYNLEEKTRDMGPNDVTIILGSTNDVVSPDVIPSIDYDPVRLLSMRSRVILGEIPYRFDSPQLNQTIYATNCVMYRETVNIQKMDFSTLPRNCFTQHGLHFNNHGRYNICHKIKDLLIAHKNLSNFL